MYLKVIIYSLMLLVLSACNEQKAIKSKPNTLTLAVEDTLTIDLSIVTSDGSSLQIDWGDGTTSLESPSSGSEYTEHTYGSLFTGTVKISHLKKASITEIRSRKGRFKLSFLDLPRTLTHLELSSNHFTPGRHLDGGYLLPYSPVINHYTISEISGSLSDLPKGMIVLRSTVSGGNISGQLTEIPENMVEFELLGGAYKNGNIGTLAITGTTAEIPENLTKFTCANDDFVGSCLISGDVADLSTNLQKLYVSSASTITGSISSFKPNLTLLRLGKSATISGSFSDIHTNFEWFQLLNTTTAPNISGALSALPRGLKYLNIGDCTASGDLVDLPSALVEFTCLNGTLTGLVGSYASLPTTLERFYANKTTGITGKSAADLPRGMKYFESINNLTGTVTDLPSSLVHLRVTGAGTIGTQMTGSLEDLPSTLVTFIISGTNSNQIGGNIVSLPSSLKVCTLGGNNIITGDIGTLKVGLQTFNISGSGNTTNGNVENLPNTISYYANAGVNTTSGDITRIPPSILYFSSTGNNTIQAIHSDWQGASAMNYVYLQGAARSSAEVDAILSALATVTAWEGTLKAVNLAGANAAPTAGSASAQATITSRGATITVTP